MLSRLGEVWRSQGFQSLSTLFLGLTANGFSLTRGHQKDAQIGDHSKTSQIMLVFEKEGIEYPSESAEHNAKSAFSDDERLEIIEVLSRFDGKVAIYGNEPIGRIPVEHLYVDCKSLQNSTGGAPAVKLRAVDQHLEEVQMVRVSLNVPPSLAKVIPTWLEERSRFNRIQANEKIKDSLSSF